MRKNWEYTSVNLLHSKTTWADTLANWQLPAIMLIRVPVFGASQFVWSDVKVVCINCIMACVSTDVFARRMSRWVFFDVHDWRMWWNCSMSYRIRAPFVSCCLARVLFSFLTALFTHVGFMGTGTIVWLSCLWTLPWMGWVKPTTKKTKWCNKARTASIFDAKSALIQEMARCHQTTSHYLS